MTAFAIMPFASSFNDVWSVMQRALRTVDAAMEIQRLDKVLAAGRITDDLVALLQHSTLCIADVTASNPNVMWEVGFASALRKPTVAITQSTDNLPFDIKDVRMIPYDRQRLDETLLDPLTEALRQTLSAHSVPSSKVARNLDFAPGRHLHCIGVTGSTNADRARAEQRLAAALKPFLGRGILWYVGSYGSIDEIAVDLLVAAGEATAVVGYDTFDISGPMLAKLEANQHLSFIDARAEASHLESESQSDRDTWFLRRADLMIIGWDGASSTTRELITWLSQHKMDHLLCYVPPLTKPRAAAD